MRRILGVHGDLPSGFGRSSVEYHLLRIVIRIYYPAYVRTHARVYGCVYVA